MLSWLSSLVGAPWLALQCRSSMTPPWSPWPTWMTYNVPGKHWRTWYIKHSIFEKKNPIISRFLLGKLMLTSYWRSGWNCFQISEKQRSLYEALERQQRYQGSLQAISSKMEAVEAQLRQESFEADHSPDDQLDSHQVTSHGPLQLKKHCKNQRKHEIRHFDHKQRCNYISWEYIMTLYSVIKWCYYLLKILIMHEKAVI